MTPTPVDPAAPSGPVELECEALRAALWSMTGRWEVACQLLGERTSLLAAAEARLEAVQALHAQRPNEWFTDGDCVTESWGPKECARCCVAWPCPTVRAALASPPEPEADEVPRDRYRAERDEDGSLRAAPQPVDQPVPPTEPGEQATCEHGQTRAHALRPNPWTSDVCPGPVPAAPEEEGK